MAYTAEEVDDLVKKLERNVERQIATAGSSVKGVAAERDLLASAEKSRDLLEKAVKGEKEYLDKVFGGSCERIGRYRLALDAVSFSDMHAKDQRWQHLRNVVETVEAVLKDLGTFKPWVPPSAKPPETLVYRGLRRRLSPGRRVNLRPEIEGGEATEFEVQPPLPAALELSPTTGHIAGVLATAPVEETTYTVVARNAAGEVSTEIVFFVSDPPPAAIAYPGASASILAGEGVLWEPDVQGTPTEWSSAPPLPSGLVLDPATGVISGASAEAAPSTEYGITASNAGGKVSVTLTLEVRMAPPSSLSYPDVPDRLLTGHAVQLDPEVVGAGCAWSVKPDLPPGLALDAATGVVSGAATAALEPSTWTVTAANAEGSISCELAFEVVPAPPADLAFPGLPEELALLEPLKPLLPTVVGQVDSFAVSPPLPAGLSLDESTGAVSGTPSAVTKSASYEVSARNATGAATIELVLAVQMVAPGPPLYDDIQPSYVLGEEVSIEVEVRGVVERFSVEPPLPRGLTLDERTGCISGVIRELNVEAEYMVTVSNEAGEASEGLSFAVVPPAPAQLSFPAASSSFTVGELVTLEPQVDMRWGASAKAEEFSSSSCGCVFEVTPDLPEGLTLDTATGSISGSPEAPCEETSYLVAVANSSGSASAELAFEVVEPVQAEIREDFAEKVEAITDLADLCPEPERVKFAGDWMIWMVHRAYLDDPELIEFDFSNMHMPPPHLEERIAPKLMKAMATNTHIEVLMLANSNLIKVQGGELATSLAQNRTLKFLNLESNSLDSLAVKEIAEAIHSNAESKLEHLRVTGQKGVGHFFGRPVEEAIGQMMEKNDRICKLGFECNDAHWRNIIDRALLRNNDFARRRRKGNTGADEEDEGQVEEKALSRVVLQRPPAAALAEVFAEDSPQHATFCGFVAQQKRLPIASQLQSFAKNMGSPLKYSQVAPLIKECRSRMLDAAVNADVIVADIFEVDTEATLRSWSVNNDNWSLEVRAADGKRYSFKSNKEPVFIVSDAWAEWLGTAGAASKANA